jgi:Autotransporter beta-domain
MHFKSSLIMAASVVSVSLSANPSFSSSLFSKEFHKYYEEYLKTSTSKLQAGSTGTPTFTGTISSETGSAGNAGVTANILNQLNGSSSTPSTTQTIITNLLGVTNSTLQNQELLELGPAFKVIQYSLEKQDLLLHKEVERELYQRENKSSIFMLAGYDNLTQKPKGPLTGYNGYNVNTPYQMLGFNQKYGKLKLIETLGASESYIQLKPAHARASFISVWGDIGAAYVSNTWQVGIDGQFGYSFLNTKRFIDYLGLKATSNHDAWNASGLLRVGYDIVRDNSSVTPYDNVSYIYGSENSYTEKGAPGANLHVKDERISTIRNQAGFKIKKPVSRYAHILFDAAWLYEKYLNNQNYSAAFAGTSVFGSYRQIVPTKNYARFEAGFLFRKDRLDLEFIYTGLYGRHFAESSGSMKFGYKY